MAAQVTIAPCDAAAAAPFLAMAAAFDTTMGAVDQSEMMAGCAFGLVRDDQGEAVGAFSIRPVGKTLWIMQAGGAKPGVDLVADVLPDIEATARRLNLSSIAITTRRPGLVRKMDRRGYAVAGITLRKNL